MKISFDFDDTLENEDVQRVAKDLITQGYDVCILTTRYSDVKKYSFPRVSHAELYRIAQELKIKDITFTEFQWKYTVIDKLGIDLHLDNNFDDEVRTINTNCKAKAVWYAARYDWEAELYKELSKIEALKKAQDNIPSHVENF